MNLEEKLRSELEECSWAMLKEHQKRGAVFVIDSSLDIINVSMALATDDSEYVKKLMEQNQLKRPSDDQIDRWSENEDDYFAEFLIISPYVLIRPKIIQ